MAVKSCNRAQAVGLSDERSGDVGEHVVPRKTFGVMAIFIRICALTILVYTTGALQLADADSLCETCEVQIGLGGTYHYWGTTGSYVLPVTVSWSENRYEFGVFRFTNHQFLLLPGTHYDRDGAKPYWGISLSRRFQLFERGPVRGFVGFGLAARSESDILSSTRWDFASQLGLRFRLPGNRVIADLTVRHWSNAGIRLPNHGQDFATLTVQLNSRLFGVAREDQIAIDPTFNRKQSLAANSSASLGVLLP